MVEARDVGHDRLLVWTGSAHNVCGEERTVRTGGAVHLLYTAHRNNRTGSRAGDQALLLNIRRGKEQHAVS